MAPSSEPSSSSLSSAISLRFIDETQRQTSSQIRRDIRSHVRKGSHEKQRRLNAAAKARPLDGARKLLQRIGDADSQGQGKLVPRLKDLQISIPSREDVEWSSAEGEGSGSNTSIEIEKAVVHIPWESLLDLGGGVEAVGVSSENMGVELELLDSTVEILAPIDMQFSFEDLPETPTMERWNFETTTPYAITLGKDGPIFQMRAKNWPFQRISGKGPGVSVWMPCSVIPLPKFGPRPCLLRSSKVVPWICNSAEYFAFKEETIRWLNKRLDDDPTHEKTIGGIVCLMSWEIARGNAEETALHMDGLERIVAMKGGLRNLCPIKQFCWKIHL
ncbi:hypothetical protein BKA65DRAFT_287820 [Rhexocercosporidium sp. MPI-PUGE-AT-0058]|nr:hypothetical protein BKA65DRAFT_287820 [Rhexocercosporidium sp. MPI-PUGE-AT-0058]